MDDTAILRRIPIFQSLSDVQVAKLARLTSLRLCRRDEIVFYEDEEGDFFFGKPVVAHSELCAQAFNNGRICTHWCRNRAGGRRDLQRLVFAISWQGACQNQSASGHEVSRECHDVVQIKISARGVRKTARD